MCTLVACVLSVSVTHASPLPQPEAGVRVVQTESPLRVAQNSLVARPGANAGELAAGDAQLSSGALQDTWEFTVTQAGTAVFGLSSTDFDTYLIVSGPGGLSLRNDDRVAGDLNSELAVQFPMAGTYQVIVTSYEPGEMGRYTLQVSAGTSGTTAAIPTHSGSLTGGGPIAVGQTVNGRLGPGDTALNSGEFTETWTYTGRAGELLTVHLDASQFDPYLMIRGPAGFSEDNDDRVAGTDTNASLVVTLPTAGEYRIMATSYRAGEQGDYTLQLVGTSGTPSAATNQLRSGATLQGELSASDGMLAGRQFFDVYTFRGSASERALVTATANGFPVLIRVIEPGGQEHVSQASAAGGRAETAIVLPSSGEYTVHVSSQSAGSTGPYSVGLVTADTSGVNPPSGTAATIGGDLVSNVPVQGSLAAGDGQLSTGEFYDVFDIQGVAGQTVTVEMTSTAVDPYLFVRGPGVSLDNDDGTGFGLNSRLQVTFPQTGAYSLTATSYAANEVGAYSLVMRAGSSVQNAATGRVYAVLGGITNYTTASRLEGCAEDATSLFTTLQQTGLLAPQSVVLTDHALTRDALRRAFQSVGSAMAPDDVFVFFFSGHGSQISGNEFDGNDETLVLSDGDFRDDELAALFDLIPGRVAIIALDSCFSGGFARDVISQPGRMGIFSSEEDVTSNVAVRFAAGGFLSYFFRNGLGGAADIDPVDGAITAGELAQYLRQQWAQHMLNERTETSSAENAWQNLVIDRGSVKVSDVIMYNP